MRYNSTIRSANQITDRLLLCIEQMRKDVIVKPEHASDSVDLAPERTMDPAGFEVADSCISRTPQRLVAATLICLAQRHQSTKIAGARSACTTTVVHGCNGQSDRGVLFSVYQSEPVSLARQS